MRAYKPSTLTLELSTAADQALSRACNRGPRDQGVLSGCALGVTPRGCGQLNKHHEALRSVKGWDRLLYWRLAQGPAPRVPRAASAA